tara:strand:- start:37401 stop:38030 length:630 start_codon:yes stop_codon:yes gene_type:complete
MADRYALVVDSTNNNIKEIPAADRLVADNLLLSGTTPTLTIGDAGEEDTKIVFDGAAQDFHIGLDDSADDLVIGLGSAVGTTPAIHIDENQVVRFDAGIREEATLITTSSTTVGLDLNLGNVFEITMGHNIDTFNWTNPADSGNASSFVLKIKQDGTGGRSISWPGAVDWGAATAPTPSTGANAVDIFAFFTIDQGTTWYGFAPGIGMG